MTGKLETYPEKGENLSKGREGDLSLKWIAARNSPTAFQLLGESLLRNAEGRDTQIVLRVAEAGSERGIIGD